MEQEMCERNLFDHYSKNPGILGLERKLLEAAAYENVNQAVFYMLPIEVKHPNDPKLFISGVNQIHTHTHTNIS